MADNTEDKKKVSNEQQVAGVASNNDNEVAMQQNSGTSVQSSNETTTNTKGATAGGSVASAVSAKYTAPKFEFDTSGLANQKLERVTIPDDIAKQRAEAQQAQIDYYEQKRKSHMRDAEQDAKTAKRLKRGKLIGSIVDASRALANLWGTTNYAPNAYTGKDSMADAYQKKYDEWNAKVKADKDAYDAAYSQLVGAKADNADENYKDWRELQKTNVEIDKHNSNIGIKEMENKYKAKLRNNQIDQFNAEQALKEKQFNESQELKKKQQEERNAIEKQKVAVQQLRAAKSGSRGGGGGGRSSRGGASGKKITFRSDSGETITVPLYNSAVVESLYNKIPESVRRKNRGFGFNKPTQNEMVIAIQGYIDKDPNYRKMLIGY